MSLVFGTLTIAYLLAVAGVVYVVWWIFFGK